MALTVAAAALSGTRPAGLGQRPARPREEEITQLRELIRRIESDIDDLT